MARDTCGGWPLGKPGLGLRLDDMMSVSELDKYIGFHKSECNIVKYSIIQQYSTSVI